MKRRKTTFPLIAAISILLLLILDAGIVKAGASEGVALCLQVIIPSLFPFFFITSYINPMLLGVHLPGLNRLAKHLGIPDGCEGLLLLGLIGGYPVGAQAVNDTYTAGNLSKAQAHTLMGYCSNAGPAFIFGVTGILFQNKSTVWLLWGIHILSAILTGLLLPKVSSKQSKLLNAQSITLMQAFKKSISVTASVCGWIVVFKAIYKLVFSAFPMQNELLETVFSGVLELSGGCIALNTVSNSFLRFVLCSAFLAFGGLCVTLQTASVTADLGLGFYLPGKLIQTALSIILSLIFCLFQCKTKRMITLFFASSAGSLIIITILRQYCRKKLWQLFAT